MSVSFLKAGRNWILLSVDINMLRIFDKIINLFKSRDEESKSDRLPEPPDDVGNVPAGFDSAGFIPADVLNNINGDSDSQYVKSDLKRRIKEEYYKRKKLKFRRGELYVIKHFISPNIRYDKRIYECKQIVWCMESTILCGVVVKQIYGSNYSSAFLNSLDCENLHVKYEPGLQIISMFHDWRKYTGDINELKKISI